MNRAGTPLLEIVSEPDMHSSAEARAFARALYLQIKYAEVSEADLYHGNMRFDVNVSVSKDKNTLGTRSETKNLNSFRSVEKAVDFEVKRQIELLEKGGEVVQETRGWDDAKQKTFSQRTKEDAHDYRYMPEPDVPPVILDDEYISKVKAKFPQMPSELKEQLASSGSTLSQIDILLDEPQLARFAADIAKDTPETVKTIINWLTGDVSRLTAEGEISWEEVFESQVGLVELALMVQDNKLSSTNAKELLKPVICEKKRPEIVAKEKNLLQVSDESVIEKIVSDVLASNPQAATDVMNGEMKAIGFLVGQVMKQSKGQANPGVAQQIIKKQLGI